jgi:hypothetical protein
MAGLQPHQTSHASLHVMCCMQPSAWACSLCAVCDLLLAPRLLLLLACCCCLPAAWLLPLLLAHAMPPRAGAALSGS